MHTATGLNYSLLGTIILFIPIVLKSNEKNLFELEPNLSLQYKVIHVVIFQYWLSAKNI